MNLQGGDSGTATVDVTFRADEFFCFEETDLVVEVTTESVDGVQASPDPSELVFTLPTGIHDSGLEQESYEGSEAVTVTLDAPSGTQVDFSTQITFSASFPGGDPSECGPDAFPSASDLASISVNVQADAEPDEDDDGTPGGNGDDDTNGGETPDDEDGIPLPAWVVPGALALAAAARRRA